MGRHVSFATPSSQAATMRGCNKAFKATHVRGGYYSTVLTTLLVMAVSTSCNATGATGVKPMLAAAPCDMIQTQHNPYAFFGPKVRPPIVTAAVFGATPQEVDAQFTQNIEQHFNRPDAEKVIGRLNDRELAGLAAAYQAHTGRGNSRLLTILASKLSDQALLRVASAFGKKSVEQAVAISASPAVKASFLAKESAVIPLITSMRMPLPPPTPPSTNWRNTLNEIYLDYRTSPELGLTASESLASTALYTAGALGAAWGAGTAVGNGINYLIDTYDPALGDAIGGTVAGMLNAGQQAAYQLGQGHFQSSLDSLFDYPITNSSNPSGPNGIADPMVQYYQEYGPPVGDDGYFGGGGGCNTSPVDSGDE